MKRLLSKTNSKLAKDNIVTFSLLPGVTCRGCKVKNCYAVRICERYPNVLNSWSANTDLLKDLKKLYLRLYAELNEMKEGTAVRIHTSGDFVNQDYVSMWAHLAAEFPEHRFYCYTKSLDLYWDIFDSLPNTGRVQSLGGEFDDRIDWQKPVAKIYKNLEELVADGAVNGSESDSVALNAKGAMLIGLIQH